MKLPFLWIMTKIFRKMPYIEKKYDIGPGFTNAWRKMYEICEKSNFIPKKFKEVKHLDICGFPGTFILATKSLYENKKKGNKL